MGCTDIGVLSREKIDLRAFPLERPEKLAMGNVINTISRATLVSSSIVCCLCASRTMTVFTMHAQGLLFGDKYGPADQGALYHFYEG